MNRAFHISSQFKSTEEDRKQSYLRTLAKLIIFERNRSGDVSLPSATGKTICTK